MYLYFCKGWISSDFEMHFIVILYNQNSKSGFHSDFCMGGQMGGGGFRAKGLVKKK